MLHQHNITLRPLQQSDAMPLAQLANNKKIWDNLRDAFPHPYRPQDAAAFITTNSILPVYKFAIEYEGIFCGAIGLNRGADIHRCTAELGYWLGEPWWGKGIASVAIGLITQYGFTALHLNRIYASVFPYNQASMRALEKAGYGLEHIAKKALVKNGAVYDDYVYALTNEVTYQLSSPHLGTA